MAALPHVRTLGAPTVCPSRRVAVVAVRHADLDSDGYTSRLWEVPLDGSGARRLTDGWYDTAPVFSPDGRWLAFLSAQRDARGRVGRSQIWVMPADGGPPRQLTRHRL